MGASAAAVMVGFSFFLRRQCFAIFEDLHELYRRKYNRRMQPSLVQAMLQLRMRPDEGYFWHQASCISTLQCVQRREYDPESLLDSGPL